MSTVNRGQLNAVSSGDGGTSAAMSALDAVSMQARAQIDDAAASDIKFCAIDDPTCEACQ
jgi:ribonucleoside-diphosphate reductase alpha chain